MTSRRVQDYDTEDFLKRVEAYDSGQLTVANDRVPRAQLDKRPVLSKSIDKDKSVNGEKRSNVQGATAIEVDAQMQGSELAYKSAYNYERTFSPSKTKYSKNDLEFDINSSPSNPPEGPGAKTYAVSEADYLLLQKLKSRVVGGVKNPHVPSRGRPRDKRGPEKELSYSIPPKAMVEKFEPQKSAAYLDEESPPSLPSRRILHENQNRASKKLLTDSYEEVYESPPSLPLRRAKKEPASDGRRDKVDNTPSLSLPSRKHKEEHLSDKMKGGLKDKVSKNLSEAWQKMEVENSKAMPPPIPPKRQPAKKRSEGAALNNSPPALVSQLGTVESTKVPDLKVKSDVFQEQKVVHNVKPTHIDYLDSMQKKNQLSPHRVSPTINSQLNSSHANETRPDSFINSALRSPLSTPSRKKPALPTKPVSLLDKKADCAVGNTNIVPEDSEFKSIKLRTTEKAKPEVPAKKNSLITNNRLSLKPSSNNTLANSDVTGTKSLRPKPTIPIKLKKVPPKDENREADVPEALDKLRKLNKAKAAPPVPSRKVSMPEAFKRVENMRQQNLRSQKTDVIEVSGTPHRNELDTVSAQGLPMCSHTTSGLSKKHTKPVAISSASWESESSKSLNHVTKTRSKGPKRKLPTKMQ